jgi:hypothetical protein
MEKLKKENERLERARGEVEVRADVAEREYREYFSRCRLLEAEIIRVRKDFSVQGYGRSCAGCGVQKGTPSAPENSRWGLTCEKCLEVWEQVKRAEEEDEEHVNEGYPMRAFTNEGRSTLSVIHEDSEHTNMVMSPTSFTVAQLEARNEVFNSLPIESVDVDSESDAEEPDAPESDAKPQVNDVQVAESSKVSYIYDYHTVGN